MLRRLFTLASAVSLLLFATTVVLWVRSSWTGDAIAWNYLIQRDAPEADLGHSDHYRIIRFLSGKGGFLMQREEQYPIADSNWPLFQVATKPGRDVRPTGSKFGFDYAAESFATYVYFPAWSALLATAILPGLRLAFVYRARGRAGLADARCRACGYDLRASPERCPECGTPVPNAASTADQSIRS